MTDPVTTNMVPVEQAAESFHSLGFERVTTIRSDSYKDNSTCILIPTRGTIHWKVVQSWQNLIPLMNQKRAIFFCAGAEVGKAYDQMVQNILNDPGLSQWKYVLTLEDDNMVPPDAHVRLIESINSNGGFDAVGGLYFTKGEVNMPMAYGDPEQFRKTGVLDFRPRDTRDAIAAGQLMEVNGLAMGCTLYRMELFKTLPSPWFVTCNDIVDGKGVACYTQDLWFCEKAKRIGKRFAVDCRVKVGHLDPNTETVY